MNFYEEETQFRALLKELLDEDFFEYADRELLAFGEKCANEIDQRARFTDREGQPKLIKFDAYGDDISEVWVNDGYRKTVEDSYNTGIVGYVHKEIPELGRRGNYIYSYAQGYLLSQTEPGFYCPVTLTMATAYLLDQYAFPELKEKFLPHVLSTGETTLYEGATFLTERQGGSDVGANVVKAIQSADSYKLYGEKYFASNAGMCGVAMVLARKEGAPTGTKGLTLFAVPWRKDDGKLNGIKIRRLKDKLGVRAVPSGEVEFEGAEAYVVGDPTKGFYYMMEALNLSRVCNTVASLGIMRRAYREAREYALKRDAFGKKLADFPMIKDSLVKMAVKLEVETRTVFKYLPLFEKVMRNEPGVSEKDIVLNRLYIALLKKETAEQAVHFAHEAIEMYGGNGYIEDFVTPRLLRDAQVLTVWEGTANILGLEVLRLMEKFNAGGLFLEEMKVRIAGMNGEHVDQVRGGIEQLEKLLVSLQTASYDHKTFHSKRVAELMVKIFESVNALEYGAGGDERAVNVKEVYIEETWNSGYEFSEQLKPVDYFHEIVSESLPQDKSLVK
ncbi:MULTISPECIES: acyl-CoA dehydrogenase family protein [unclassified Mesobacillus]|uniref:acyl-CoA dehydrogenase family protein n=1 Tax=unclassified Mesobacillus TaxID=2675270 RepID=UPI00203CA0E7|nr:MULTISPECIES: acyl-CoA dehydrogenase family protein [unclassified Mesobacillus]MCM3125490.1 acyl-CoA dehydrogenase family protein [Mesobacillus sp. MER 33]MCM3234466.1 acyl-CoA dehydrogenase family protein [Mesobacillus sp. MER 48]